MMQLQSYAEGAWITGSGNARPIFHAVTGEKLGDVSSEGLDFKNMHSYARRRGGPALRGMTFHERGRILKELALHLSKHKKELYQLCPASGATRSDAWFDIDGGIGTLFVYASKGRRDFPNETFYLDGVAEQLSKGNTFVGRHLCVPLRGVALHINAFNFPCWGMLEKFACNFLAGLPAIVKPASATAYIASAVAKIMLESGLLPEGALQIICGGIGDLFEHLDEQDVVTFTGSAETGRKLRVHPNINANSIRFNLEADSLNCSILGPDGLPGTPEFDLFINEVAKEMTVKAGQKCTAIRRTIVPSTLSTEVIAALEKRLALLKVGNPENATVEMGPLVSRDQVNEVRERIKQISQAGEVAFGSLESLEVIDADKQKGAFCSPTVIFCPEPLKHHQPHEIEAFGPVTTVMPYGDIEEACELARMGRGSLVASLFTANDHTARELVLGTAAYHGRILIVNSHCAKESTGHGSPLPHLVHGGPGRAGGGEELGGTRGVLHYMQRTALQGSPTSLTKICSEYIYGGKQAHDRIHPFRKYFEELEVGETLVTHRRTVTEADIVNFANISGDNFYAHTDELAARDSLFKKRVAHGYFLIAAAAGLFVDPAPGPVLANYGMENLRFLTPVGIGDTIQVIFTCKRKTPKRAQEGEKPHGIVHWDVEIANQRAETVAQYTILTLVERRSADSMQ